MTNIIMLSDSYKNSHAQIYPPNIQYMSSYIESRGGEYDFTLFFGLQIFLKEYLSKRIKNKDVDYAEKIITAHGLPFKRSQWDYIVNKHGGFLPVSIQAVPEGSIIPTKNVLVQVVNTDPNCAWLPSFIETSLLRAVWYGTTVATRSKYIKNIIKTSLNTTATDTTVDFKLHDFGYRGVSSNESGSIGGLAHLVNFRGTDTIGALEYASEYYSENMAGFSIPATEHSTIISWGKKNEVQAYENVISQFGSQMQLYACVADSYDFYNAVENMFGDKFKSRILDNYNNFKTTLVIRSDSGDPCIILPDTLEILYNKFGGNINSKGFKVLHPSVRVLHGDGINENTIQNVLDSVISKGFSTENVAFGMGGELLQNLTRDTLKFAMKPSAIKFNGMWEEIYKDPKTDSGKKSKAGRLALVNDNGYKTLKENDFIIKYPIQDNVLKEVFRDGQILENYNFQHIRDLSDKGI